MTLTSALAIYTLFWTLSLFLVLPWYARTAQEVGEECLPGHADSAPHSFRFGPVALRTTLLSAMLFGLFYANFINGWIGPDAFDWVRQAP